MRIGIVSAIEGADWGGSEPLWVTAAQAALAAGASVSICLQRPMPDHADLVRLRADGAAMVAELPDTRLAAELARRAGVFSHRLGDVLTRRLSPTRRFFEQDFDVLLFSEGGAVPSSDNMQRVLAGFPRTRLVALGHSRPPDSFNARTRRLAIAYLERAQAALFVSQATIAHTEKVLCRRIPHARVVRNPVNLVDTGGVAWPVGTTATMALVGRLDVVTKGQDLLFEVLATPAWRERDWVLDIYGTGKDEVFLRDLAVYLGLADRIRFRGHAEDIRAVWRDAQILLQPSRIESAPLSIVEAMLCARPVVTTAVGGIREWVTEGESGFVAPAATAELIAQALERAWAARADWEHVGARGRSAALQRYDPDPGGTLFGILVDAVRL